mgnify:CR=1 FL=1
MAPHSHWGSKLDNNNNNNSNGNYIYHLIFEKLLKGREYETIRKLEDDQGLYLWEIKIPEEDGHTEYLYMRKGKYAEGGQASNTAIHIAFFNEENFPVSGSSIAKYIDGEWKLTP